MLAASLQLMTRPRVGLIRRLVKRGAPTPLGAFLLAFTVRILWITVVADPILYDHPYQYFTNAQWIAERPDPLNLVLNYDNWRVQYDRWTAAPLYYLFLAVIFRTLGDGLALVSWVQCGLGGLSAACLTAIGSRLGGARGRQVAWLYAFYLPAVQVCGNTLTEALHTPLMLIAFERLLGSGRSPARHFTAGLIHGFAALTRSISSAFFVLLALHRAVVLGWRRATLPVVALALGGCCAILPWTARNYFLIGEPILIETFAFENLWFSNTFARPAFKEQQRRDIVSKPTLSEQREAALYWTWRNVSRNPDKIGPKIVDNFKHLLRPEGLHRYAGAHATVASWRSIVTVLFDDVLWAAGWLCLPAFCIWGRRSPARLLVLLWLGYSLLMLVVVFFNEGRYRSVVAPFVMVAAASAWGRGPRLGRWISVALSGLIIWTLGTGPLLLKAVAQVSGSPGNDVDGRRESAINEGFVWMQQGDLERALRALKPIDRSDEDVRGPMALAWLYAERGDADLANRMAADFHLAEYELDPTLLQEAAWEMVPAPRRDLIDVGGWDVGAVKGFSYPLPRRTGARPVEKTELMQDEVPHRWTRRHSWIRMHPAWAGPTRLTLRLGVPPPFVGDEPLIRVTAGGTSQEFQLSRDMKDYSLETRIGEAGLEIRIDSPTWNLRDQPSDQGVRVEWARLERR